MNPLDISHLLQTHLKQYRLYREYHEMNYLLQTHIINNIDYKGTHRNEKQVDDSQTPVMSVNTGLHTNYKTSETTVQYL